MNFATKELFKGMFKKYDHETNPTKLMLTNLAAGGGAGTVSLAIFYPLEFIRT